eukprot:6475408-Amphidinium_carterae.3
MFADAPKLKIAGGIKISELQLGNRLLWTAKSDIKDFFYNLRFEEDDDLVEFFALPTVRVKEVLKHFADLGGELPESTSWLRHTNYEVVHPCMSVVPMGWGWAMYMAQRVHSHLVLKYSELPLGNMLEDHVSPPLVGDVPVVLPYVDNLNLLGCDREAVQLTLSKTVQGLRDEGFEVHEIEQPSLQSDVLGYHVDGVEGIVSVKDTKLAVVLRAWRWMASRPVVTGKAVERLLGHTIMHHDAITMQASFVASKSLIPFRT